MFRIENYITSIILSYVDRYIKNFRRQDAQLSLWEGDGSLHNLDLDLEVLEQELNLPFSFVSGHIHDLLIHVPWTRIASEPVKITINTIECVMKLKTPGASTASERRKRKSEGVVGGGGLDGGGGAGGSEENVTAPSYMSSLVNKIVCNLSVTCNNLILKYVEEDIVLSMNIKTLSLNAVNAKWLRQFSELTSTQLILRKLIDLTDVTICLDKRNASGRIESYLEPLLYKCSLTIRLSRSYKSVNSAKATSTRIGIRCQNVTLSISEPQVSMLLRLILLARMTINRPPSAVPSLKGSNASLSQGSEDDNMGESWASWVWSWVPAVLPTTADTSGPQLPSPHTLHLGIYVDSFTLDFKLLKGEEGRGWESVLQGWLGGCYCEMMTNSSTWTNVQMGVSHVTVQPCPHHHPQMKYVSCGEVPHTFYSGSLFENPDTNFPQRGWELHMATITESLMLERAPFFVMDYLTSLEPLSSSDSQNDLKENALTRYVFGPVIINVCGSLIQKLTLIHAAILEYDDYFPYNQPTLNQGKVVHMDESDEEEVAELPRQSSQFTAFGPVIKLYHASSLIGETSPHLLLTMRCADGKYIRPNAEEMTPPFETSVSLMLLGLSLNIVVGDSVELVHLPHTSSNLKVVSTPENLDKQFNLNIDMVTACGSRARWTTAMDIISSNSTLIKKQTVPPLVNESKPSTDEVSLKLILNEVTVNYAEEDSTGGCSVVIGSAEGQTVTTKSKTKQEVLGAKSQDGPVFQATVQRPFGDIMNHPYLLVFRLRNVDVMVHPSLTTCLSPNSGLGRKISGGSLGSGRRVESTESPAHEHSPVIKEEGVKWLGAVICGEVNDITFTFITPAANSLALQLPTAYVRSSQGKLNIPLDNLLVNLPPNVWSAERSCFPWSVGVTEIELWTVIGKERYQLVERVSLTCTVALAARGGGTGQTDKPSLCLHVDTTPLSLRLSSCQVALLDHLVTRLQATAPQRQHRRSTVQQPTSDTSSVDDSAQAPQSTSVGLKWWVQWTLAKCTVTLYSRVKPIKMVLEVEDVFMTLDIDTVYQKLKLKIATASIHHFVRESEVWPWRVGPYKGVVMKGQDSRSTQTEMLALTLTRASAASIQAKLNTPIHSITRRRSSRDWVVEAVVVVEPVVVVAAPGVVVELLRVLEPLGGRSPPRPSPSPLLEPPFLPLLYFDLPSLRAFLPTSLDSSRHNVIITNMEGISLKSEAVNPVSRKIVRSDVGRVSGWDDRQYQLDLILDITSGRWSEVELELECGEQNPAVYWNSPHPPPLTPLLAPLTLSFILAPPIIASGFVVSGLSLEANVVSEFEVEMSLEQLRLVASLVEEMRGRQAEAKSIKVDQHLESRHSEQDSGLESSESSATPRIKEGTGMSTSQSVTRSCSLSQLSISTPSVTTKRSRHRSQGVPIDVLLTGKGISIKLYNTVDCEEPPKLLPLIYITISQPYVSLEKQADTTIYKGSVFEVEVRLGLEGGEGFRTVERDSYPRVVIETRSGDPDPYKGIPPALLNIKAHHQGLRAPTVEVELGRPIKWTISVEHVEFLKFVKNQILSAIISSSPTHPSDRLSLSREEETVPEEDYFSRLKCVMHQVTEVKLSTKQIALHLQASNNKGVLVSIGSVSGGGGWRCGGRVARCSLEVASLTLSTLGSVSTRLILTPWALSLAASLSWEPPYFPPAAPLLRLSLVSEFLYLELSYNHLANITTVLQEFRHFFPISHSTAPHTYTPESDGGGEEEEEVYRDDLQAGAFQFVSSGAELPLAYQVTFPTRSVMAWTYPAPRAITNVKLLPIPHKEESEVGVRVEWWDGEGWVEWSEGRGVGGGGVSATWRARLEGGGVPVEALAAALRVTSLYCSRLLPTARISLALTLARISFATPLPSPTPPAPYTLAPPHLPPHFTLATLTARNLHLLLTTTRAGSVEAEWKSRLGVEVVNCRSTEEEVVVEAVDLEGKMRWCPGRLSLSLLQGHTSLRLYPPPIATLYSAFNSTPLPPYLICNDSIVPIRFGQVGTVEDIELGSMQCHYYCWSSTRQALRLRFSLWGGKWSEGVPLEGENRKGIDLEDDLGRRLTLVVCTTQPASTTTRVVVMGQLLVKSLLDFDLELRVVSSSITERQRGCKVSQEGRSPSLPLCRGTSQSIRVATTNHWSGLVPINTQTDAWLVKVPLEDKHNFLSIWCQIFWEKDSETPRCLVLLSPIYMLRSLLPCEAKVLIATKEMNSRITQKVGGEGVYSTLHTPGTTTHHHTLTFHIEGIALTILEVGSVESGNLPSSSPHLELSYSSVDGKLGRGGGLGFDALLGWALSPPSPSPSPPGPWLPLPQVALPWRPALQPDTVTHIKVKAGGDGMRRVCNSVVVELQPWAVMANSLGLTISIYNSEKLLCTLPDCTILAPPALEDTFYLGVEFNGEMHKSNPLQLSKGQAFYMPHIAGLIPYTGSIQVDIPARQQVVSTCVESKVYNGMRVVHVGSSCLVINLSSLHLTVGGFILYRDTDKLHLPPSLVHSTELRPQHPDTSLGSSVYLWTVVGGGGGEEVRYLVFESSTGVSTPVCLNPGEESLALFLPGSPDYPDYLVNTVLAAVVQRRDSLTYVTIDDQTTPQLVVHNKTVYSLIIGSVSIRQGSEVVEKSSDWDWKVVVEPGKGAHYHMPPDHGLTLTRAEFPNSWCSPIAVVEAKGPRLVSVPHCQDMSTHLHKRGFTTHVTVAMASHDVVAASDIRTRLSLQSQGNRFAIGCEIADENSNKPSRPEVIDTHLTCRQRGIVEMEWFVRSFVAVLCSEMAESLQCTEVAALSLTNLAVTVCPTDCETSVDIVVSDLQLDNLEFPKGGYDFGVIVIRGGEARVEEPSPDWAHVSQLLKRVTDTGPSLQLTLTFDTHDKLVLEDVKVKVGPLEVYLEDTYVAHLRDELLKLIPSSCQQKDEMKTRRGGSSETEDVVCWSLEVSRPLRLRSVEVCQTSLLVSLHTSTRFYIALDHSPLSFAPFTRRDLLTTPYRLGHALTLHYFLGAIYGTGWALGSLQLLGAPAGLARSLGTGLRSFVTMPYRGFMEGPTGFLMGILHGSASLMKHVTAGTLMSVTRFASSWSRTLDRLTLGEEDLRYAEEMRRLRPQGFAQALRQGLTELGVSILGGVGGVAGQPLHGSDGLVGSVGRGLVGLMARPISGAAELVALTGHGILSGAGWSTQPSLKHGEGGVCVGGSGGSVGGIVLGRGSGLKYWWKVAGEEVVGWCEATTTDYCQVCLLTTRSCLLLVAEEDSAVLRRIPLAELSARADNSDPTLVRLYLQSPDTEAERVSRVRIAEYVRQTDRLLGREETVGGWSPEGEPLLLFVHPHQRSHLLAVLELAIRHTTRRGFPLL